MTRHTISIISLGMLALLAHCPGARGRRGEEKNEMRIGAEAEREGEQQ